MCVMQEMWVAMTQKNKHRKIMVVTGSRADFGLLEPVMKAIQAEASLKLFCVAAGLHLVMETEREIKRASIPIDQIVEMQIKNQTGYAADVQACARGVSGFGKVIQEIQPHVLLVLGDRIEAFAAATAASLGGVRLAHAHGGDRAEGVADEAMRHAISKMANLHFPATRQSAKRLEKMGENKKNIFCVGSPAIDGLSRIAKMDDNALAAIGINPKQPFVVVLQHGAGGADDAEYQKMKDTLGALENFKIENQAAQVVVMGGNKDVGWQGVWRAVDEYQREKKVIALAHLNRNHYIGLLKRARALVGNSSGGLIEAAAIGKAGMAVVNIGPRQNGREKPMHVIDADHQPQAIRNALTLSLEKTAMRQRNAHGYGEGDAGKKIARVLRKIDLQALGLHKCNAY